MRSTHATNFETYGPLHVMLGDLAGSRASQGQRAVYGVEEDRADEEAPVVFYGHIGPAQRAVPSLVPGRSATARVVTMTTAALMDYWPTVDRCACGTASSASHAARGVASGSIKEPCACGARGPRETQAKRSEAG